MAASRPKSTGLTLTSRIFTAHAQSLFYDIYKQQMADLRAVRPRLPWGHDQQIKTLICGLNQYTRIIIIKKKSPIRLMIPHKDEFH